MEMFTLRCISTGQLISTLFRVEIVSEGLWA